MLCKNDCIVIMIRILNINLTKIRMSATGKVLGQEMCVCVQACVYASVHVPV